MRKSYSAEILLLFSSASCGMIASHGEWWVFLIGAGLMSVVSYFITPLLKEATIKEYIVATYKTSKENQDG